MLGARSTRVEVPWSAKNHWMPFSLLTPFFSTPFDLLEVLTRIWRAKRSSGAAIYF